MVLLHVKRSEQQQFLFQCSATQLVRDIVADVATIHNLRQTVTKLKLEGAELAQYGPAKQPDKQGIDTYDENAIEKGEFYQMDPTGRRTGNACNPTHAKVLLRVLDEAEDVASHKQVDRKVALTKPMIEEKMQEVKGAVMICYPMGLPAWDPMRLILDGQDGGPASYGTDDLDAQSATLWFAGKIMIPENKLSVHTGRHENTKAVVKLQKQGQGAPSREPIVDKDTQQAMLAYYRHKQEEQEKLKENEDDSYLNSGWASSKSLKSHFTGVSEVRFR
eukprot:jgi/Ulvmu1/7027/UM033_0086.1